MPLGEWAIPQKCFVGGDAGSCAVVVSSACEYHIFAGVYDSKNVLYGACVAECT
jgi:hypothetical protein